MTAPSKQKSKALFLIFLGWLVYATSYLGKVNYSANITQIIDFYDVTKAQAGIVPTFFFFAYGIGQVFNGAFCKRYNIKWVVFISLIVSASINLVIGFSTNFAIMKWLWLVNGFVLSMLWPTLVRMFSETMPQSKLGTSSVVMGTTVATGTLVIYGLSSLFASFNKFKLSFYTAGIAVIVVAFIWIVFYNKAISGAKNERMEDTSAEKSESKSVSDDCCKASEKKILFACISVLCFFAVGVNLIKDGLTTWVPSILKDEFSLSDSISILLTLFLPILAVFGNASALKTHKMIPDYVSHCVIVFGLVAILVLGIIGSLALKLVVCMLIGLVAVNFLASSLNSLITSIFPLFMREKVNSGLFAGILNGFCYLGSALSSYGLGVIADNFGWNGVFWCLLIFCVAVFAVWIGYVLYKKKHINAQ